MVASDKLTNPFVSVIVPVYADPDGLRATLDSVIKQHYSPFEVIVSVTPYSGETLRVAEEYMSTYPDLIDIIVVEETGRARARNAGIDGANGEIVTFIDANITMKPDWLGSAVSELQHKDANYLTCNVIISSATDDNGFIVKYDQALSLPVRHYVEDYHFTPTAVLLLTRSLISDVGVFDPELTSGEDREFGNRVYRQGYKLHIGDCEVYHPARRRASEHIKKAIRIGIGIEQLRHQYPKRYSAPSLISPISYAPPSPSRIKSRLSDNDYEPGRIEILEFYLFNYILKLCQQFGRWRYYRSL
jgi:glycosyltransferase involved in cell wall biosynthesis